ncbi:SMODS domain-containing nucleotidyltransferase [Brochothrix thermosphacta]|uniref:SMODS domain-containing nucleotidyltransferase n=1 Tax=Brochothrix thermosphacta TaxID=2756 RepID=UPI0039B0F528
MATVNSYFTDFLKNIRLTQNQIKDLARGHNTLRSRLLDDDELSKIIETTFLQGSYKRNTAVKPKGGKRSDVDIIVVTNIDADNVTPDEALEKFKPFLDKHYADKYTINQRSIGIELSYVDLDLVITAKVKDTETLNLMKNEGGKMTRGLQKMINTEEYYTSVLGDLVIKMDSEDKKDPEPILIPDTSENAWSLTNPLAQIYWTIEKNKSCNGNYINVVKALKWWKKHHDTPKYPKGYPLEHIIGQTCPNDIDTVAQGITTTLEEIVRKYPTKPVLIDHGVKDHDVFGRITEDEYREFYDLIKEAASIARKAIDESDLSTSVDYWRDLLGTEFPPPNTPPSTNNKFSPRNSPTEDIGSARFG